MENQADEQVVSQEAEPAAKPKKEKLTRKERRQRWKAAKKARRDEEKEYYRYAPRRKRLWNLYLKKPICTLLVLAIVVSVLVACAETILMNVAVPIMMNHVLELRNRPLTPEQEEQIYELSPIDEDGAAKIEALPAISEDETWTVCVYLVGSNLEDDDENDLSMVTIYDTQADKSANSDKTKALRRADMDRYTDELAANGLNLPAFFYEPVKPVAYSTPLTQDVTVSTRDGAASTDIGEMTSGVWGDNINVVIQTGGATRWSNRMINPNRTQRFNYHNGEFKMVADLPLQPSSTSETLADFIRFCKDEYPSDHRILVLWNHGAGPFGYGNDSIYNGLFTLNDIRSALKSVYRPNIDNPPFDIIGFDACLMSTLEVTHALDGFADYYCLSEEVEPGDGWDYGPWLQAMTEDPTMNPAQVARAIADSYIDFYMRQNINMPMFTSDVTFSVLNAKKSEKLYDAYCDLAEAQLKAAAEDLGALAELARAGHRSTRYAQDDSNIFNTVDLGNYTDFLVDSYPDECARIKELMGDAVLYHRENGALSDSTGIAVYFPTTVNDLYGLVYYLDYVYNISDDDSISTLYYYKQSGSLTDEMREYVATLTDVEPKTLDVTPFQEFTLAEPDFDSEGFLIPVSDELQNLVVGYELEVACLDGDGGKLTDYGREEAVSLDGEGHLMSEFDGRWIHLDNEPLYVEIVSSSASAVEYRAHVNYNGEEYYMLISRDRDTDELSCLGLSAVEANLDDQVNTRGLEQPDPGDKITPIYEVNDLTSQSYGVENGKTVIIKESPNLKLKALENGTYLFTAVVSDMRGDKYYSAVTTAALSHGSLKDWQKDSRFYARNYA